MLQMPGADPLTEQQADNVHEIRCAGDHLLTMVNEVLNIARIESGRLDISLEPISVVPEIVACLAQIKPLAAKRRINVALEPGAFYTVQADRRRLREVLLNLLSNAVKYNREGGTIKVDCTLTQAERLRISVHDSGYGIADKDLPRLFQPFECLKSSYEDKEGTGIGLALCRRLVEGMQGEIGVSSTPGEGSTFWFELPLSAEIEAIINSVPEPVAIAPASDSRHKVLYIEDNPANLVLV
ncbi:MAG: HAMP domain-containing sensor histidine kinase [Gammaproteobacteria bacterium]|nr:HAMP domain-containing sensor histidine kinase [Gammaproteobacteria bacterium]